jgi:DNA polymerase III epsilon subunit-like protein
VTGDGGLPLEYVILDLEWNGTYSKKRGGFLNEIIEFGAVKTDANLQAKETFSVMVRPQVGKKLSGKVQKLTNISEDELSAGVTFTQALSRFRRFWGDAVLLTWGTSDILALMENALYYTGDSHIPFLRWYADLQAYCERRLCYDPTRQMGLAAAALQLGIDEAEVEHHRALDDSLLSLDCFRRVYDRESFLPMVQDAQRQEFYDRISFKTTILCDLEHPLLHGADMEFVCSHCGRRAERRGEWELRNKSFRAPFWCAHCGRAFRGRVQFKLKYEGVVVKKRELPAVEEKSEEPESKEQPVRLA